MQVDKELRNLTDHSKKLARLAFGFKRQKAKALQKKVESIKSALTLQVNIVQLTQEEIGRPQATRPNVGQAIPRPNRFRKLVESAVQANRQVIESAQHISSETEHSQERHLDSESIEKLDLWGEELPDTAPWLYQLVFYPPVPPYPTPSDELPHQASVSEQKDEIAIDLSNMRYDPDTAEFKPSNGDMTMIVRGRQTEPSLVVGRLLSDWTVCQRNKYCRPPPHITETTGWNWLTGC